MKRLDEDRSQFRHNLKNDDMRKHPSPLSDSVQSDTGRLLKPGAFSLLIHVSLVVFLLLNLKSATMKGGSVYRVTLVPLGDGKPPGHTGLPGPGREVPTPLPDEKIKSMENHKGTEMPEIRKNLQEKTEKRKPQTQRIEEAAMTGLKSPTKKEEKPDIDKGSRKSLQEALEDIHKKVALDAIRKKVAQRDVKEKSLGEGGSTDRPFQGPVINFSGNVLKSGPGSGPGTGTGIDEKAGTGGSPWGSSLGGGALDSMLSEYSSRIWAKIEKEWTLPGDVPKGKVDLETIIVIVIERDGKIQKSWFEKRSGNGLYDQMAMRAIKKAEPLPPIPKEFSDDTFEIGLRFHPD